MKKTKLISLFLIVLMLSLIFVACGNKVCEHEYDNTYCDTKCNFCGKPYNIKGHLWATNDAIQCTHKATCGYCGLTEGEDNFDHLFTDENGNVLEKCARCNKPNPDILEEKPEPTPNPNPTPEPEPEPEPKINTTTLQYTYDYGWHVLGKLTLLCDDGYLDNSFGRIEVPNDIVAGDIIKIVHTGEIWTELSYPGSHGLRNGEVISYSFEYAHVIHLTGEAYSTEFIKNSYDLDEEYVIVDRVGNFVPLDEYNGDEIYLVIDQKRLPDYGWNEDFSDLDVEQPDKIIPIASMFAYNPRDLEAGQPSKITAEEASEIAEEHFYKNYAEDGNGFRYSQGMSIEDGGNYTVYFKKLYTNGTVGDAYYYTIDKVTGEILEISIEGENNKEDIKTSRFMYTYAYWHVFETLSGKAYAKLLCDDSYIHIDIEEPLDITAGDMLIVEHTGYFMTAETYPGSTDLYDGEVISYRYEYSTVFTLLGDEIDSEAIKAKYDFRWGDEYVILNRDGDFVSLDEYEGTTLYLVLDMERAEKIDKNEIQPSWDETKIPIACALAYNPRDIEDGKVEHNITEAEAIEIASTHFEKELGIDTPPDGFVYKPRIIEGDNTAYFYVFFDLEYVGDDSNLTPDLFNYFTYTYKIRKETGEIISIESDF